MLSCLKGSRLCSLHPLSVRSLVGQTSWNLNEREREKQYGSGDIVLPRSSSALSLILFVLGAPERCSLVAWWICSMGNPARRKFWIYQIGLLFRLILGSYVESFRPWVRGIWSPRREGIRKECVRRFRQFPNILGSWDLGCLQHPSWSVWSDSRL